MNNTHRTRRTLGFTMIEIMIVCVVIGVLAAIAFPSYRIQMLKIKNQEAIRILMAVWEAQKDYKRETGSYTWDIANDLDIDIPTPKYFSYPVPVLGPPIRLGFMVNLQANYSLEVREDGSIQCAAPGNICQKMGFGPWPP